MIRKLEMMKRKMGTWQPAQIKLEPGGNACSFPIWLQRDDGYGRSLAAFTVSCRRLKRWAAAPPTSFQEAAD